MDHSQTASLTQIAALADIAPNNLHSGDLPPAVPLRTGKQGRPEHVVPLDELADFALAMTAHLTEAECRLRIAIAAQRKSNRRTAGFRAGQVDQATGFVEIVRVYDQPRFEEPQP
ncbi:MULTISPECIES: hypothetical protein [Pseudomonas]|uniref:hypothetical protein n=1 Tax=Pseudomonas TaxID=286 RepID=UPI0018D6E7C5|nr:MULTISPECIES: hypothetical protein [Pseudomonas]MBH3373399.1 hypothetical protein [Pseudomonas juntendi]MBS6039449.1 hypothetical protein [Pseudomonas sp.]CAH0646796.1 hypothetical protein PSNVIR_01046 [Pseudomonas sp. Nvir]